MSSMKEPSVFTSMLPAGKKYGISSYAKVGAALVATFVLWQLFAMRLTGHAVLSTQIYTAAPFITEERSCDHGGSPAQQHRTFDPTLLECSGTRMVSVLFIQENSRDMDVIVKYDHTCFVGKETTDNPAP